MKKKNFLIESPPDQSSLEWSEDLNNSKKFKSGREGQFVKRATATNKRDRTDYYVENPRSYAYEEFEQEKERPEEFNDEIIEADGIKYDSYDIFNEYYKRFLKALDVVEDIKKNPDLLTKLGRDLKHYWEHLIEWDRKYSRLFWGGTTQPGISITGYEESYKADGTFKYTPKPIFVKKKDGSISFNARKVLEDVAEHAALNVYFGIPLTISRELEVLTTSVVDLYNVYARTVNSGVNWADKNVVKPIADTAFVKKTIDVLDTGLKKTFNFFEENKDIILTSIAMSAGDGGGYQNKELAKHLDNAIKLKKLREKTGLTDNEIEINRKAARVNYNRIFQNNFYDDDEDDEKNLKETENLSKIIQNKLESDLNTKDKTDLENNKKIVLKSFENIRNFKNEKISDIFENDAKIDEMFANTNTAIENYKSYNNNNNKNKDEDFDNMNKLFSEFEKLQQKIPEFKSTISAINKAPDFKKIKDFYKNYGILNLGSNQQTLFNNFSVYLKNKSKLEEEVLDNPLDVSNSKMIEETFKENFTLLGFKTKLIDLTIYYLNRFTENLLSSGGTYDSYRGQNFLASIYNITFRDLNRKIGAKMDSKLLIKDFINISDNIKLTGNWTPGTVNGETSTPTINDTFFSKNNVLLSKDDKIIGMYCRNRSKDKVHELILHGFDPDEDKNIPSTVGQYFENNKNVIKKIVESIQKIPVIDTIVLLSKNPDKKDDYFLYQIDISSLYSKIFSDENLLGYIIEFQKMKNKTEKNNEFEIEMPVNSSEELENYKALDLRNFIETSDTKEVTITIEHPLTKDKNELKFKFEYFQFLNKQIKNSLDNELNPIFLEDLFKLSGLEFLTNSNSIFKDI